MSYKKQNFVDNQILTADNLNHIEDGISNIEESTNILYSMGLKFDGTDTEEDIRFVLQNLPKDITNIKFPRNIDINLSSTLVLPSNVSIDFSGSTFYLPTNLNFDGIRVLNSTNIKISNLNLIELEHDYAAIGDGLTIINCQGVILDNINISGFYSGISIDDENFISQNINITNCITRYCKLYGLNLGYCKDVHVHSHISEYCYLDGIKLCRKCYNVNVMSGFSSYNGVSYPTYNGNGIDLYAGGNNVIVSGLICIGNGGTGIYIKSGDLNYEDSHYIENIMINNCICKENECDGLQITSQFTESSLYLPTNININGGLYVNNKGNGVYVKGKYINISNANISKNSSIGLNIMEGYSINVTNVAINVNGNSDNYGKAINISSSNDININGCNMDGIYSNNKEVPDSMLPSYDNCIRISESDNIIITNCIFKNYSSSSPVGYNNYSTINENVQVKIDYGNNIKTLSGIGSVGSTMILGNKLYTKLTPVNVVTGWVENKNSFKTSKIYNGNGTTKTYIIDHNLGKVPTMVLVTKEHNDMLGNDFIVTKNATSITIILKDPVPAGTNNVRFSIYAE